MFDVYQTKDFTKWLNKLKDRTAKARIITRIRRIELGNLGDVKSVGEGISEVRIPYGPAYRLYYIRVENTVIVLLCGGDKSTQSADIEKAKEIKKGLE